MKKALIIVVTIVVVAALAVLCYLGNAGLEYAVRPEVNLGRSPQDTLLAKVYHRYPEMEQWRDSLLEHHLWRDTMITAQDGYKRHAIILVHDSVPQGASVMVHGYTDCAILMMRYFYLHYEVLGRNVIVPELFGHGLSEGDNIRFGWKDRLDLTQIWLPLAHKLWPDLKIVEEGLSMGAATTMMVSGEDIPDSLNVVAFIEDCGYCSTWEQLKYSLQQESGKSPFPILYMANLICNIKYGWDMKESSAETQLAKCKRPMLFIHGDADDFVPTWMVYRNYEAKTQGYKELYIVPGAAHARSIHNDWDNYVKHVKDFIQKVGA